MGDPDCRVKQLGSARCASEKFSGRLIQNLPARQSPKGSDGSTKQGPVGFSRVRNSVHHRFQPPLANPPFPDSPSGDIAGEEAVIIPDPFLMPRRAIFRRTGRSWRRLEAAGQNWCSSGDEGGGKGGFQNRCQNQLCLAPRASVPTSAIRRPKPAMSVLHSACMVFMRSSGTASRRAHKQRLQNGFRLVRPPALPAAGARRRGNDREPESLFGIQDDSALSTPSRLTVRSMGCEELNRRGLRQQHLAGECAHPAQRAFFLEQILQPCCGRIRHPLEHQRLRRQHSDQLWRVLRAFVILGRQASRITLSAPSGYAEYGWRIPHPEEAAEVRHWQSLTLGRDTCLRQWYGAKARFGDRSHWPNAACILIHCIET